MNYYNEFDAKAAAWLRELIKEGVIAPGVVDERSISDVSPHDLNGFTQCHFFAGVGGWSYALRLAGWPDDRPVWTGSCPCQPFSPAGKQLGEKDPRHLWPKFYDLISFGAPAVVFGEQVAGKKGVAWLAGIRADLEGLGYAVGAADLCSASAGEEAEGWIVRGDSAAWERIVNGAPNIRQRLYWMANAASARRNGCAVSGAASGAQATGSGAWIQSARRIEPARGGTTSGMANPDGGQSRDRRLQSGGQHGQQSEDGGAVGRLADVHGERCAERSQCDGESLGPEQQASRRHDTVRCGHAVGLGDTGSEGGGRHARAISGTEGQGECERLVARCEPHEPLDAGPAIGLGDSDLTRSQGRNERGNMRDQRAARAASMGGFWRTFDIVHCTDGKARRIEPGSFPLATGVSGRVGLLRGYGNAINAELAADFIETCSEVLGPSA